MQNLVVGGGKSSCHYSYCYPAVICYPGAWGSVVITRTFFQGKFLGMELLVWEKLNF